MLIPLVVTRGTKVKGSHHGDSPLLKPTGIQIATKPLPGSTTREHRKLIGVKTIDVFEYGGTINTVSTVWSGVLPGFQNLTTGYREDCLMCCPSKKVIKMTPKVFVATRRQIMQHFTRNDTNQCQNGSSNLLTPYRKLSPTFGQRSQERSGRITLQSVLIDKLKFFKATRHAKLRKIEIPRFMVVEALSW